MNPLPPHLARIVEAPYPRFSEGEMAQRRGAVEALLAQAECDHLVFRGANRFGSAVQWLTQWPVLRRPEFTGCPPEPVIGPAFGRTRWRA